MCYSIELRDRIYVKGYGKKAKNIGTHATKVAKSTSNKSSPKLLDNAKKSTKDAIKTTSKRAIQKDAETTGNLIGNKIADKIINVSKSPKELHLQNASKEFYSKMEYKKIINLLDNTPNQLFKFRKNNWIEINDQSRGVYNANSDIRFKTAMSKSSLCDYNDAYILAKGR